MKLGKQLRKCMKYSGKPELPWEVERFFPTIDIACTGIAFERQGDYASIEEAVYALEYLLKEIKCD